VSPRGASQCGVVTLIADRYDGHSGVGATPRSSRFADCMQARCALVAQFDPRPSSPAPVERSATGATDSVLQMPSSMPMSAIPLRANATRRLGDRRGTGDWQLSAAIGGTDLRWVRLACSDC